jgi:glutamate/tyrosine decarboxylase-like PLP-dependent enzyme
MRESPAELSPAEFRTIGHRLVDDIASFLETIESRPVAPALAPSDIRKLIGAPAPVPDSGREPAAILEEMAQILFAHSTLNGHPRFFGYITAAAAPIGALADLVATAVNPNGGAWGLSPVSTELEKQVVRWVAELIGFAPDAGGLLVSGGNVANMVCLIAAIRAKAGWNVRDRGVADSKRLIVYASSEVHTWLQKGADICGLGVDSFHAVDVDSMGAMRIDALRDLIASDRKNGFEPAMVVGTGGSVSTGAIDPLREIAALCAEESLWFHVDGAYGAPAAMLDDAPADLAAIAKADSVAIDPHKWLYSPLEAGCALVRNPRALHNAFAFNPPYYKFDGTAEDPPTNFHEWGPQNSRGFRALKVWATISQVGREGYKRMISEDIALSREMYRLASEAAELEPLTQSLSIATFRYVPKRLRDSRHEPDALEYLNHLNTELLSRLQSGGRVYVSNAVVGKVFALRACIVNFRTGATDVQAVVEEAVRLGRLVDHELAGDHAVALR